MQRNSRRERAAIIKELREKGYQLKYLLKSNVILYFRYYYLNGLRISHY